MRVVACLSCYALLHCSRSRSAALAFVQRPLEPAAGARAWKHAHYASADPSDCRVKVIYDESHTRHAARSDHSECPARATVAADLLQGVAGIGMVAPAAASGDADALDKVMRALHRVHKDWYIEDIAAMSRRGGGNVDFDTYVTKDTYDVCVRATSAWLDAVDSAVTHGTPAFALTRPPGHHATPMAAMGFCFFNFAGAAAMYALDELGLERVALLDFDVHFGNGVAAVARQDARLRYCSLHEAGSFPFTGTEELAGGPHKNLRQLEVQPQYFGGGKGTWAESYEKRFKEEALPWLVEFDPQLLIVSAGYDALEADPLATLTMQPENYREIAQLLRGAFGNKVVFGLEGGYAVEETACAIHMTLQPFLEP
ncbi:hypothetical protein JKP88DRAFT_198490 [Tribonema minus]|uniref:Histone deacetylase domain-containing protein n=1 Tax=Tribonema minus TaxID=303371 RepID=A0A835Z0V1_9STRA|nr:hypothetical protein JKP88DRAFT_198490 [Tribonema minus]